MTPSIAAGAGKIAGKTAVGIALAAFLFLSCNVNDEAVDRIDLRADSVLLTYDRVLVQRLDAQGISVATLFNAPLTSMSQLSSLPVPGYHGGQATFAIKGYVGTTLVYDVTVNYDGTVATMIIVKPVYSIAMSIENPTDQDLDGYYSQYDLKVDVNTNSPRDTLGLVLTYRDATSSLWQDLDSVVLIISNNSGADAYIPTYIGYTHGLVDFRAQIYNQAGELVGEQFLLDVQEETSSEDFPGYEYYIINHTGTNLSVNLDADGQTDSVDIPPNDTVLAISTTFSPYVLTYRALCTGNTVYWADTLYPGSEISDTVRLTLGPSFYVLETQNLSTSYIVDQVVIDSGTANEWVHNNWIISNDGIKYELGAYPAGPSSTVIFRDRANSRSWRFSALSFQTNATYGYRYVTLNLY